MKKILSSTIVLLFVLSAFNTIGTSNSITLHEAVDIVINNVLTTDKDEVLIYVWGPVSPGVEVSGTKEFLFQTPDNGFIVYIDLYPRANLFHPVQYVLF